MLCSEFVRIKLEVEAIRSLFKLLETPCLLLDERGVVVAFSPELSELTGERESEIVGQELKAYVASSNNEVCLAWATQWLETSGAATHYFSVVTSSQGQLLDVRIDVEDWALDGAIFKLFKFAPFEDEYQGPIDKSYSRLELLLQQHEMGLWEYDVNHQKLTADSHALKLMGLDSSAEASLTSWLQSIDESDRARIRNSFERLLSTHAPWEEVYQLDDSCDEAQLIHIRAAINTDSTTQNQVVTGTIESIDQPRYESARLQQQRYILEGVDEHGPFGVYIKDLLADVFTYYSESLLRILGYSAEELNKLYAESGYEALIHPNDRAHMAVHFARVAASPVDMPFDVECRVRAKNRQWVQLWVREWPMARVEGIPNQLLGAVINLDEIKLGKSREGSACCDGWDVLHDAPMALAKVKQSGRIGLTNTAFKEQLMYSASDLNARNLKEIVHPDTEPEIEKFLTQVSDGEEAIFKEEIQLRTADGQYRWVLFLLSRNARASEDFICSFCDIHERKLAGLEVKRSEVALERFRRMASHDLVEPVRKMMAFSSSLKERISGVDLGEDGAYELDRLCDAADRMMTMITELRTLTLFKRADLNLESVLLKDLVDDAISQVRETKEIREFPIKRGDEQGVIEADCKAISSVLAHVIANTGRYGGEGELCLEIEVKHDEQRGLVVIQMRDNGVGIPEQGLSRACDPFKRFVGRDMPGVGMGLAVARHVIELHGGNIELSNAEPHGLIVTLTVPCEQLS